MLNSKKLFLVAILAFLFSAMQAQTASPYSRYGYGILRDQAVGPSKAMGGIGFGLRNNLAANPLNPASYSAVDSLTFLFDMGLSAYSSKMSDQNSSKSDYNGNFDYLTMLMPLSKKVGMSLGVLPYSSVGYLYGSQSEIGNIKSATNYAGSGGFSQVYVGLGYEAPLKGLSVGFNVNYVFGSITNQLQAYATNVSGTAISSVEEKSISQLKIDLGAQYQTKINKDNELTLGAVYTPNINSKLSLQKIRNTGYVTGSEEVLQSTADGGLPSVFGLGFTVNQKNKFIYGADVTFQNWKNLKFSETINDDGMADDSRFNNVVKYNIGTEYTLDPSSRKFYERIKIRGGVNFSNSYMNVNTTEGIKSYNQFGATLGFGFPIRDREAYGNRTSYVNISFEYRKINPEIKTMVKEEYFGVSLNANINELWFLKRKIF